MNQILFVQGKKNKGPVEIKKVVRFFSIAIIIFGLILLGQGAYALYKNIEENKRLNTVPQVDIQRQEDNVIIKVNHDKAIRSIIYNWNDEENFEIETQNSNVVEEEIDLPTGTNTLNVKVTDINGKETAYQKEYIVEELKIDLSVIGNNIKITVTDTKGVSYMTYKWNNEEEVTVNAEGEDSTVLEQVIEIPTGLNTLEINAVNVENVSQTKTQEVRGIKKPEITAIKEGEFIVITVTDEEGLEKITHVWNDGEAQELECNGLKTFKYKQPLVSGDNYVTITAENILKAKTVFNGLCVYSE